MSEVWPDGFLQSLHDLDLVALVGDLGRYPGDMRHLNEALAELHRRCREAKHGSPNNAMECENAGDRRNAPQL